MIIDIAEILLKVVLNTINHIKSKHLGGGIYFGLFSLINILINQAKQGSTCQYKQKINACPRGILNAALQILINKTFPVVDSNKFMFKARPSIRQFLYVKKLVFILISVKIYNITVAIIIH